MKLWSFLGLFTVMAVLYGCGTTSDSITVTDTSVIKIVETGKNKDEAYDLSMKWMAQVFKSSKDVIQYSDKGSGTINGKGSCTIEGNINSTIRILFSIIIDLKDSKTRLSFKAISWSIPSLSTTGETTEFNETFYNKFKIRVDEITSDYQKYIASNENNW